MIKRRLAKEKIQGYMTTKKFITICSFRIILCFLLILVVSRYITSNAWSWTAEHHKIIVQDTIEYMDYTGDELLQSIAQWLLWAPGYNYTSGPDYKKINAAQALWDEVVYTDEYKDMMYYCDMWFIEDCAPAALIDPKLYIFCDVCKKGIIHVFTDKESGFSFEGYNMTSLNHYSGTYYQNDQVSRNNKGENGLFCSQRDPIENLGYYFKGQFSGCSEKTEGDCMDESKVMEKFGLLNSLNWLHVDPDRALKKYNGITCHYHEDLKYGMKIPEARYLPLDNIAEYWIHQWRENFDVVLLGAALHMIQDAMNPHHNYGYQGRGHSCFEDFSDVEARFNKECRGGGGLIELEEGACENHIFQFPDYGKISEFFKWPEFSESLPENLVIKSARKAACLPYDLDNCEGEDTIFDGAIVWGVDDMGDRDFLEIIRFNDWDGITALGHNLSVAGTASILRNEFEIYYDQWKNQGYCKDLYEKDLKAWYSIVPGPLAGDSILVDIFSENSSSFVILDSESIGTRHPYYNGNDNHSSNEVIFRFRINPNVQIHGLNLIFSEKSQWHEGDYIRIRVYLRPLGAGLRKSFEFAYYYPLELKGDPSKIEEKGIIFTLTDLVGQIDEEDLESFFWLFDKIEINLIHGNHHIYAVGIDNTYDISCPDQWSDLGSTSQTSYDVWGNSFADEIDPVSENTYAVGDGVILHYNGESWINVGIDIAKDKKLFGIWGSSASDIFAVGNNGTILHYDGESWSSMDSGTTSRLNGIWGSSASDIFAVGDNGTILRYNGNYWRIMDSKTTKQLNGIWGTSHTNIFAVGDGTILHYNGEKLPSWSSERLGLGRKPYFTDIWGSSAKDVFAVGEYNYSDGVIYHYNGILWSRSEFKGSPLYAIWGGRLRCCTPERKFGFQVDKIGFIYSEKDPSSSSGGYGDWRVIATFLEWLMKRLEEYIKSTIFCTFPGPPCDDEETEELIAQAILDDILNLIENGVRYDHHRLLDIVHNTLTEHLGEQLSSPALSAYITTKMWQMAQPGYNLEQSGLLDAAVSWSKAMQEGLPASSDETMQQYSIDFLQTLHATDRHTIHLPNGEDLSGVDIYYMSGYPGFRDPTSEELMSEDKMKEYLKDMREDRFNYFKMRKIEILKENIEAQIDILNTDRSINKEKILHKIDEIAINLSTIYDTTDTYLKELKADISITPTDDGIGIQDRVNPDQLSSLGFGLDLVAIGAALPFESIYKGFQIGSVISWLPDTVYNTQYNIGSFNLGFNTGLYGAGLHFGYGSINTGSIAGSTSMAFQTGSVTSWLPDTVYNTQYNIGSFNSGFNTGSFGTRLHFGYGSINTGSTPGLLGTGLYTSFITPGFPTGFYSTGLQFSSFATGLSASTFGTGGFPAGNFITRFPFEF